MADVALTVCVRCGQPCELGDLVYVMVSATIENPNSFLGVTEIGCSGPNGVVHQSCFKGGVHSPAREPESEDEPFTLQTVQRTSTLEGFDLG